MKAIYTLHTKYFVDGLIGIGGSARVLSATDKISKQPVSIKIIPKESLPKDRLVYDGHCSHAPKFIVPLEVYILRRLCHPHIIKYIDCLADDNNFYLITERFGKVWNPHSCTKCPSDQAMCSSSDLLEYIHSTGPLPEDEAKHILKKLVQTCIYLKSINVYHCDIKAENILINEETDIRLIDFGSSWIVPSYSEINTKNPQLFGRFYGTYSYAPPEIIAGKRYRVDQAEIWSLGILLYVMVCNNAPFESVDQILTSKHSNTPSKISKECNDLLESLFIKDPAKRYTLEEVAQHPFLNPTPAPIDVV